MFSGETHVACLLFEFVDDIYVYFFSCKSKQNICIILLGEVDIFLNNVHINATINFNDEGPKTKFPAFMLSTNLISQYPADTLVTLINTCASSSHTMHIPKISSIMFPSFKRGGKQGVSEVVTF